MNQPSSTFKRPASATNVMTLTSKSDVSRKKKNDSATTTLLPSILVVDDDPSVLEMLHDAFDLWGFDVFLAENGREGLSVLARQRVDGILLDIHMPVMGGRTMLDEMRWLGYQTPVVVMSGGLDVSTLRQLLKEGAQGFTVKPFSLPSLRKLCTKVFDSSEVGVHSKAHLSVA